MRPSSHRRRAAVSTTAHHRAGHTLVELVIACVVFALGVLSLQRAMLLVLTQARDAWTQERAVGAAAAQYERMVHAPCASTLAGTASERGFRLTWQGGALVGSAARLATQRVVYSRNSGDREHTYAGAVRCR